MSIDAPVVSAIISIVFSVISLIWHIHKSDQSKRIETLETTLKEMAGAINKVIEDNRQAP